MFVYAKTYDVHVEWDLDASVALTSGGNTGRLRINGDIVEFTKTITMTTVQVKNGPFTLGSHWYNVGETRYETFGDMVTKEKSKRKQ